MKNYLLIGLIIILVGAGGFIVYNLVQNDQAPEVAQAGSLCCDRIQCNDGTEFGQDVSGSNFSSCQARADEACRDLGGTRSIGAGQIQCRDGSGDGEALCITETTSLTGGIVSVGANCENIRYIQYVEDANGRNSDNECIGTAGGQVSEQRVSTGFSRNVKSITSECGKCVQIDLQNPDRTDRVYGSAYYTGDCPVDTPTPTCGEPDFVPGPNQCGNPGTATCDSQCNPITVTDKPTCGEPDFVPGPNQCGNPGTATCDSQCNPITITDTPIGITISKNATSSCGGSNQQIINYNITVSNTESTSAEYSEIEDTLPQGILTSQISNVNNNGTISNVNGSVIITWPGSTIAGNSTEIYSYTVIILNSQRNNLSTPLENTARITYLDENNQEQTATAVNSEPLSCEETIVDLPSTNLENYIMYYIAVSLILISIFFYQTKLFSGFIELIFTQISKKDIDKFEDSFNL